MKLFLAICLVFVGSIGLADHHGAEAPGHIVYKLPSGELTKREVSIFVPAKGEGEVVLTYGEHEAKSDKFMVSKKAGATRFTVLFKEMPGAPEGTFAVFSGAYLRGTNAAVYYGDIYAGKKKDAGGADEYFEDWDGHHPKPKHRMRYAGGFGFHAKIEKD